MKIYENRNLEDLDGELWKEIEGYNGDYEISNLGRIKSFKCGKEKISKQSENKRTGYLYVGLSKNRKVEYKYIHILMYETHIEEIQEGCIVHHKDFTKNNFMDNFQMMTNEEHTILHHTGLNHSEKSKKLMSDKSIGEKNPASTLTEQDIIQIRIDLDEGVLTQTEISKKFGVCHQTISLIKNRKRWKHII